jgi:hypothetical protein
MLVAPNGMLVAPNGMLVAPNGNKWQQVAPGGSAIAFRFAPRRPN